MKALSTLRKLLLFLFLTLFLINFNACTPEKTEDTADEYPVVTLPEGADPENRRWKGIDLDPKPPVLPLPVADEQDLFLLPYGYEMKAVLTEPQIQQPGAINFDGNGRMYVLELRSYMLNADSEGTLEPISGISRWEDKDNDGVYETGTMFVDSLIFPRFVLPYGPDRILTMESNSDEVFMYIDTDNDGEADKKEFFTDNFGRAGNVEHQQGFLYWGMDNWLYSTVNPFRVRETQNGIVRESTGSNKGQWGIAHDDDGKLWFQGGATGLPGYFQFPIHYGDYLVENEFAEGFEIPYGAPVKIADMQGGMGAVRIPDGSLNRVTGAAGNDVFRGHRLPDDLKGKYFYGEPVARIVRQIHEEENGGLITLHNSYQDQQSEFIKSTDPLFRPVDMATAPDGTMYIVDMYHGIIQEGQWTPKGSYLRLKIEQYQLDKVVGLGRIWRLSHRDHERDTEQPRMYEETAAQLVEHLKHENGWWRDMAQQILVQRQDRSVVSALESLVEQKENLLARFHALWVLEGLNSLKPELVRSLFNDPNPRMRIQALWVSETLYKNGDLSFGGDYLRLIKDEDVKVAMRAMMTAKMLEVQGTEGEVKRLMAARKDSGIHVVGRQILNPPSVTEFFGRSAPDLTDEQKVLVDNGMKIYTELCSTCHGPRGAGTPAGQGQLMAPSFVNSKKIQSHRDYAIKSVLRGVMGEMDGVSYSGGLMIPMAENTDEWVASVLSFIRVNFENESTAISPEDVARVREATKEQKSPYQYSELIKSVPTLLEYETNWKVTASHTGPTRKGSTEDPAAAFNFEGWTSGETQKEGMWFQIEFPEKKKISEIQFISQPISRGWREGSPPPLQTSPSGYDVMISDDGESWSAIITGAESGQKNMVIAFDPVETKFIRIQLTKSLEIIHGEWFGRPFDFEVVWNMQEMKVFAAP